MRQYAKLVVAVAFLLMMSLNQVRAHSATMLGDDEASISWGTDNKPYYSCGYIYSGTANGDYTINVDGWHATDITLWVTDSSGTGDAGFAKATFSNGTWSAKVPTSALTGATTYDVWPVITVSKTGEADKGKGVAFHSGFVPGKRELSNCSSLSLSSPS